MTAWRDARTDLDRKIARLKRARRAQRSPWQTAILAGSLGWMLVLPAVLGGLGGHHLGRQLDQAWPAATGVIAGLAIGIYGVWRSVRRTLNEEDDS